MEKRHRRQVAWPLFERPSGWTGTRSPQRRRYRVHLVMDSAELLKYRILRKFALKIDDWRGGEGRPAIRLDYPRRNGWH